MEYDRGAIPTRGCQELAIRGELGTRSTTGTDDGINFMLTCMCLTNAVWAAMSWVGAIFCSLGTKPATRDLLGMLMASGFLFVVLPSVRDLETLALASSPIPISLFTIIALRTKFMNLVLVADISGAGAASDTAGGASD